MTYEKQRKTLWNAAAAIDTNIQAEEAGFGYHEDQLMKGRMKVARWKEESAAIKAAAESLQALDESGIELKLVKRQ